MRIAIGAVLGVLGGPATYARELILALATSYADVEFVVFTDAPELIRGASRNLTLVRAPLPGPFAQPFWDHVLVPRLARRYHPDLYHGTKGVLPGRMSCPQVVTIHDLAVYHFPETFALAQRLHQRWELPRAVRRATRIIAVSEHARQDLVARFQLNRERVVPIPHGVTAGFTPEPPDDDGTIARRLGLPSAFILYAGTIQPRKNVEALVEAFTAWSGPADWQLVIAGRLRPRYRPAFVDQPPPRVRYLGAVSDAQLATLYRHARALVSPSAYEGFGLSLLEAMACGCVVVAGGNSAAVELVDGVGILLNQLDVASVRSALEGLAADGARREEMRRLGLARAAGFRWEHTARATMGVYRNVLGEGG